MIKYIQKLKAKKGFTLVELIVVIAIIGVLAAILIPTMLGYVTQSKVTSANSTAASIKNEIDAFLTSCDTNGYGMKKGNSAKATFQFTIHGGSWNCTLSNATGANAAFNAGWTGSETGITNANSKADAKHTIGITADLAQLFPEIKEGAIVCKCVGGKCVGVAYQNEINSNSTLQAAIVSDGDARTKWWSGYKWDADTLGIDTDGHIVGTAPVLQHNASASGLSS